MKLSEAIRLGSMLKPQGRHHLLYEEKTCALGAACEAVGIPIRELQQVLNNATFRRWPILRMAVASPVTGAIRTRASVSVIIQSLNDYAKWTREQIADFVATIEPPETPPAIERAPDEEYACILASERTPGGH